MANLCCVIDELTAEGLMPGNKRHAYVLRKMIRSLIEETWLQSGEFVDMQDTLGGFMEGAIDEAKVVESVLSEEVALRSILSNVATIKAKNPGMTPEKLHATFGIKPSLLGLMQ